MQVAQEYNRDSFLDRVYRKSKSVKSRKTAKISLNRFDAFCFQKHGKTIEQLIPTLKTESMNVYHLLDDFVTFLSKNDNSAGTTMVYVSYARRYLTYQDVDIVDHKFDSKVNMPKILHEKEPAMSIETTTRVLQILPIKLKLLCMGVMTTLRRPNEIMRLRPRDFDFDAHPTRLTIPANISKNRIQGKTRTTSEYTSLIKDFIHRNNVPIDGYIFGSIAESERPADPMISNFRYHIDKIPDLSNKSKKSKQYRHDIHIYSFKDFGYTRVDRKLGKNFADGMKGDKNSEYHNMIDEEIDERYLEVEPYLTIFNADKIRKEIEVKHAIQSKQIEELTAKLERATLFTDLITPLLTSKNKYIILRDPDGNELAKINLTQSNPSVL